MPNLGKRIEEILNKVYIHGLRNSTKVIDLPKDEITIADATDQILEAFEELLPK